MKFNKIDLTKDEFSLYLSPRYYRLVFRDLKPKTKNGDLVAALNELIIAHILTRESSWSYSELTKKGIKYKLLIKGLIDMNELHGPDNNGLFDYRSEMERKAIIGLVKFLSAKLNFNEYINYLHIPVFKDEDNSEWMELFEQNNIDFLSTNGRDEVIEFLKERSQTQKKRSKAINECISCGDEPIQMNLTVIRKFIQKNYLKRAGPLLNHFKIAKNPVFNVQDRKLSVNFQILSKITELFDKHLSDFKTDGNKWLNDYFKLLKVPRSKSGLFGFRTGGESFTSNKDSFLNLAIEGPRIFAEQFSILKELGDLNHIIFPINNKESIVISVNELDKLFYFTIESNKCNFQINMNPMGIRNFPEKYITFRGDKFGKLISRSRTVSEAVLIKEIIISEDSERRKKFTGKLRALKEKIQAKIDVLSGKSASIITICQMITQKFNSEFGLMKCTCFYRNGFISFEDIGGRDKILTSIHLGNIKFGNNLRKSFQKFINSLEEITDISKVET